MTYHNLDCRASSKLYSISSLTNTLLLTQVAFEQHIQSLCRLINFVNSLIFPYPFQTGGRAHTYKAGIKS